MNWFKITCVESYRVRIRVGQSDSKVLVAQLCLILCNPMQPARLFCCGILQARMLEWIAIPFSRGSSQPRDGTQVSCIASGFFFTTEPLGKPKADAFFVFCFLPLRTLQSCCRNKGTSNVEACQNFNCSIWVRREHHS